ncbi:ice-binding family protein [Flavobacterium ovatum]|uniref:ice-binding family protein n=1 Tax=Flavobacterium ovatum TaxID=1928857 RepID=UPI0034507B2D
MKTKLILLLTSAFFILNASATFAQYSNPTAPVVGTTSDFLLFTSAGAITNSGTKSIYAGNVGTNGGALSGFETLETQPYGLFQSTTKTSQCASDLALLYNDLSNRTADLGSAAAHEYGGTTITPGIYHNTGAIAVTGDLTLDGGGDPDARFIIRSGGAFTTGANSKIILTNGTEAKNVFWVIDGAVAIAANVEAKGTFINTAAISLGASCKLEGGILTTAGAITTLDNMSLASPFMFLKENQTITIGTTPADLLLTGNSNPIVKWETDTNSDFTNPIKIDQNSATLLGSCIGPLSTTTYFRVVVLIDGINVNSNTVEIKIIPQSTGPDLGATASFVLFSQAGDITSAAGTSTNDALLGTNAGTFAGTGTFTRPALLHTQDSSTQACKDRLQPLFDSIKAIPTTNSHAAALGAGETLTPGIYQIASASTLGGTLTLNGQGDANSLFVIKITGALSFAASSKIILTNGVIASNIFWNIDGALDIGASSEARGNFICLAGAITIGNNCIVEGRIFTIAGAIGLQNCKLSMPVVASSNQTISLGSSPTDLTLIGYIDEVVKWEKSTDSTFSNPTAIPASNTTILSSEKMGNIPATTYFRAIVTIGSTTKNSTIATITIDPATIPLIVSSNQEFCSATQPENLILSGSNGLVIKWQSATDSDFTTPTDIINTTNILNGIEIGIVSVTTFYRAVVQNCSYPIKYAIPAKVSIATLTTWNGTSWDNGLPSRSKSIVFTEDYTANENIDACSVTINNGAVVIINPDFTMTITNGLTVSDGSLTFENNSSLIQINETIINSDNITYKRESTSVRNSDYTYWSSPVAGQTLATAFSNSPSNRIYSFNAFSTTQNWKKELTSTIMSIGTGYIVQGPQTNSSTTTSIYETSFLGKPNNGIIEIPIGPEGTSNLIGNPYPSAIDADTFLNVNSSILEGTIYFWTHATAIQLASQISNPGSGTYAYTSDDYASYNLTGGAGVAAVSDGMMTIPSGKIAAGQAFFSTSKTSNANVQFNNNMRLAGGTSGSNNSQFFKINTTSKTKLSKVIKKDRIWLNLTNSQGAFKQTLIGYITGATNEYNDSYDGESFDGNKYVDFYSIKSNKNLAIQGKTWPFDTNDEVPLGFKTTINGNFKISIDHLDGSFLNQSVFIKDKLNSIIFNLKNGDYIFTTAAGTFNDRFILLYTNKNLGTKDFSTQQDTVLVSSKNKQINIISTVETIDKVLIYDVSGREIYQKNNINDTELLIPDLASSHQPIFIKTVLQNKKVVNTKVLY